METMSANDIRGLMMALPALRSRGDFDVSAVARQFGGGGHKAAAGFSVAAPVHLR